MKYFLFLILFFTMPVYGSISISYDEGYMQAQHPSGGRYVLVSGNSIHVGYTMISSGDASVTIKFDDRIVMYTNTPLRMVILQYDDRGIRLHVEDGEVFVTEVDTDDGRVVTITTEYSILEF